MAQVSGLRGSYSGDSYDINPYVPQKRAIADLIDVIDPHETPLLRFLGIGEMGRGGANKVQQFRITNWPSISVQWLEDTLQPLTSSLSAAATLDTATGGTATVKLSAASVLRTGDVFLIGTEYLHADAVSGTAATVTRKFGGTSNTMATNAAYEIVSRARVEGAASTDDYTTQVTDAYNYTQIFQGEVYIPRSTNKLTNYGMTDEYDRQVEKKFIEQVRLLEKAMFHGYRNSGSSNTLTGARSMGGFPQFITTNTTSLSGAALTQKDLEDEIQNCWNNGGYPDLIICGAWVKRKIASFYSGSVRTTRDETTGGVRIDTVETEFGDLDILMSRWCPTTNLYIVQSEYVGVLPFDEFFDEPLAKTGDFEKGHVVGEYTSVIKNEKAHGIISSISTSS